MIHLFYCNKLQLKSVKCLFYSLFGISPPSPLCHSDPPKAEKYPFLSDAKNLLPFFLLVAILNALFSSFAFSQPANLVKYTAVKDSFLCTSSASRFYVGKFPFFRFTSLSILPDTLYLEKLVFTAPSPTTSVIKDSSWRRCMVYDVVRQSSDSSLILSTLMQEFIIDDPNFVTVRLRRPFQKNTVLYYDVILR